MNYFYEIELTICNKNHRNFKTNYYSWFYKDEKKADQKFIDLDEKCRRIDDFCKGWKYLCVIKRKREFDD